MIDQLLCIAIRRDRKGFKFYTATKVAFLSYLGRIADVGLSAHNPGQDGRTNLSSPILSRFQQEKQHMTPERVTRVEAVLESLLATEGFEKCS